MKPLYKGILAGIEATLGFLVAFLLCNYSLFLSVCMSLIGGLALTLIVAWWNTPEEIIAKETETSIDLKNTSWLQQNRRKIGIKEAQQKRKHKLQESRNKRSQFSISDFFRHK